MLYLLVSVTSVFGRELTHTTSWRHRSHFTALFLQLQPWADMFLDALHSKDVHLLWE